MKQKQFRTKGKQREVKEKEKEQIEEKVLKNREEKKKKESQGGGGDNPAHKVYNVYVLLCFVTITGERGQNQDLARKAISIYTMKITIFFKKTFFKTCFKTCQGT